jgi:glycosyltransferase involved in cell wall biosynthesis
MTPPLVSVIMPVYNGEKHLRIAVESILAQTYWHFELVAVDDGSTDHSIDILREFKSLDERVVIHQHPKNMGVVAALNTGIEGSQGVYIARMDADDISMPDRLEKQVAFLDSHAEIGLVGSCGEMVKTDGAHLLFISMPTSPALILWSFCFFDPILHPSVCMRRPLVEKAGGYRNMLSDDAKGFPEDYDLWVRMIRLSGFSNLPESLVKLRRHTANLTESHLKTILKFSADTGHHHIEYLLGHEVPSDVVKVFWKTEHNKSSIPEAVSLLDELVRTFMKNQPLSVKEQKAVKADAAWRLIKLIPAHIFTTISLMMLWRAFYYDPLFFYHAILNSFPIIRIKLYRRVQNWRL